VKVLVLGINYAPEPVGIGPYTAGTAIDLAGAGHAVTVVCAKPYYPSWRTDPAFAGRGAVRSVEEGVSVVRVPIYVPRIPGGRRRLLHHLSFALAALPRFIAEAWRTRPDVVFAVAPSLLAVFVARLGAWLSGARLWLHIQDFEVEAAFATGLLAGRPWLRRLAHGFERRALRADRVSAISPQMCAGLVRRGVLPASVVEFRNWAELDAIRPLRRPSRYRLEWAVEQPHVAVYSGNIANKQGIEVVVEAARLLRHRRDLAFVVCGEGPQRERLVAASAGLDNIQFRPLQPRERLEELLGMASIHLLPQLAGAADLVLPSKLTNMLASGRPVVAIAHPGTGLAREVEGCGLVVPPGDAAAFATAIESLIDDAALRERLGRQGRLRAEARWDRRHIATDFQRRLSELAA